MSVTSKRKEHLAKEIKNDVKDVAHFKKFISLMLKEDRLARNMTNCLLMNNKTSVEKVIII